MKNLCTFSPCRRYRYSLRHCFEDLPFGIDKRVLFILLNPSIADEKNPDPTFKRVRSFARREGASRLEIANCFAWVSTQPAGLFTAIDPIGPGNDESLLHSAARSDLIICGWGKDGRHANRDKAVMKLLHGYDLFCLGVNKDLTPKHPLYLPANAPLIPFWRASKSADAFSP